MHDDTGGHQAIAFTHCLRTHGEPDWPDPTSHGNFNISQIDIRSPRYMRSLYDCIGSRPAGIKIQESTAQRRAVGKELAKFATCLHSHGYVLGAHSKRLHAVAAQRRIPDPPGLFRPHRSGLLAAA